MAVPKEILMSLYDIIQQFVQICETREIVEKLAGRDKNFYNEVKCINNLLKHQKKNFNIIDFVTPDFKVGTKKVNVLYNAAFIPVDDGTFRLRANWSELKEEIVKEIRSIKKYKHYKHYLQDNDVIDTIIRIYNIIKKNFMKML